MWRSGAFDNFGHCRSICLSSWDDAATGCAGHGSDRKTTGTDQQATRTRRQAARTDRQTIGVNWQTTGSIRELVCWNSAAANTRANTVKTFIVRVEQEWRLGPVLILSALGVY